MKQFPILVSIFLFVLDPVTARASSNQGGDATPAQSSGCTHATCGHQHGDYNALREIVGQWTETLDSNPVLSPGDRSVVETLVGLLVTRHGGRYSDLVKSLPLVATSEAEHHHHHHDHQDDLGPRWRRPFSWAKSRGKRFARTVVHFAKHASADIVEGLPEYGLAFVAIVTISEAVDHLVLDEFIPVVGQVPFCMLIADVARRVATLTSEARTVWWRNAAWRRPFARQALVQWHRARVAAQKSLASLETPVQVANRPALSVKVKRPSFLARVMRRDSLHQRIEESLGPLAQALLTTNDRTTSAWREVARRRLGGKSSSGGEGSLQDVVRRGLERGNPAERARSAYESMEVMQQSKGLASALVMAANDEKKISWAEMIRMRWRIGRLAGAVRRIEREVLALAAKPESVTTGEADRVLQVYRHAKKNVNAALTVVSKSVESKEKINHLQRLTRHTNEVRLASRLVIDRPGPRLRFAKWRRARRRR